MSVGGQHRITPGHLLDVFEQIHPIELDPCWNLSADPRANVRFMRDGPGGVDGLRASWSASVRERGVDGMAWVNPPWREPLPWAKKCAYEWDEYAVPSVLWLPCYPETAAAQVIWETASLIAFWGKRLHHPLPPHLDTGRQGHASQWPMWAAYFGPQPVHAAYVLGTHAHCVHGWAPRDRSCDDV